MKTGKRFFFLVLKVVIIQFTEPALKTETNYLFFVEQSVYIE